VVEGFGDDPSTIESAFNGPPPPASRQGGAQPFRVVNEIATASF